MKARYCPCLAVKLGELRQPGFDLGPRQRGNMDEFTVSGGAEPGRARRAHRLAEWRQARSAPIEAAQILLATGAGVSDAVIATSVGGSTVCRTKRRFVAGNLEFALSEEARPGAARKLTGKEEALLVATACTRPPEGRKRWTLNLLTGEMVKLTGHDDLSSETVSRRLSENELKPWQKDVW